MGTVTIGADTFDVYGSSAALASYANGSAAYYAAYAAAAADTVKRTHVEATRLIALMPFEDAANAVVGTAAASVATACYELTIAALTDPDVLTAADTSKNVRAVTGKVGVEFFAPVRGARFPARVMAHLAPLLATATASSDAVSGAGYVAFSSDASDFDDDDRYTLTSV